MAIKNKIQAGDGDPRHGTDNGYRNHGCRCEPCRKANTAYCNKMGHLKKYRDRLTAEGMRRNGPVPRTGTSSYGPNRSIPAPNAHRPASVPGDGERRGDD